jgi:hypothetical protein
MIERDDGDGGGPLVVKRDHLEADVEVDERFGDHRDEFKNGVNGLVGGVRHVVRGVVRRGDGGKERGDDTAQTRALRKHERGDGEQDIEKHLEHEHFAHVDEAEEEAVEQRNGEADERRHCEDEHTVEDAVEDGAGGDLLLAKLGDGLEEDDGGGVVEDGLAEEHSVEVLVDSNRLEEGEHGDGVGGGDERAEEEALEERERRIDDAAGGECKENASDNDGGNESAANRHGGNGADVGEEALALGLNAARVNDRRKQRKKEELRREHFGQLGAKRVGLWCEADYHAE